MTPEYLAGLFDGEGCIDVQRMYPRLGRNRFYVRPRIRMAMAENCRPLLEALHAKFGGGFYHRKAHKKNQQGSWSLEWLSNDEIRRIIDLILPHLIVKAEQAKLVLWWLDNASGRQFRNTRFGRNEFYAGMEQAREAFAEELRAMKTDPERLSDVAAKRIASLMRMEAGYVS